MSEQKIPLTFLLPEGQDTFKEGVEYTLIIPRSSLYSENIKG
jgi:hypothetical protein